MVSLLEDDVYPDIRAAAMKALAAFGPEHAGSCKGAVAKAAKSDPSHRVREAAQEALLVL